MHIDSIDLMIFVGVVVINSFYCITAGGVEGNFVFVFCYFAAATLLIYGAEDVEELTDAFEFGVAGSGVHFCEGNFSKTGGGGQVSGKTEGTHAAAVGLKFQYRGECVLWLAWGERLVVVELEHLLWEWRVDGEVPYRVIVDVEAIFHGFDDKAAGSICENPVELSTGEVFAELCVGQIHAGEFSTGFFQSSALAENPWDKFELSYVFFIRDRIGICGISDKVQSGHAESLFIDRVVVKWIAVGNMSHTDDCIVLIQNPI